MPWRIPKIRFRMRTLLVLVGLAAIGFGLARDYWAPAHVWRRAVRSGDPKREASGWEQVFRKKIDGLTPEETRAEVVDATNDGNPQVRTKALWYVRDMVQTPSEFFPIYLRLLSDPWHGVRSSAAAGIGDRLRAGGYGRVLAVPKLLAMLDDPEPWTRKCALEALGDTVRGGQAGAKDPLLEAIAGQLDNPDETVWLTAAHVLSRCGRGEEAVDQLKAHMLAERTRNGGKDAGGTGTADNALARIASRGGERSDEILKFFLREVYRPGQGIPNRFLFALEWIHGPARDRAIEIASGARNSDDLDLRTGSTFFLESMGRARDLKSAWLEALHHPDPEVRSHALNELRLIAGKERPIRDAMRAVRDKDPDPEVRKAAVGALYVSPGFPDPDAEP